MVDKNLPKIGHTEIGDIFYSLQHRLISVSPASIISEGALCYIDETLFCDRWKEFVYNYGRAHDKEINADIEAKFRALRVEPDGIPYKTLEEIFERMKERDTINKKIYFVQRNLYYRDDATSVAVRKLCQEYPQLPEKGDQILEAVGSEPSTSKGRFSKRVSSYVWKELGIRLSTTEITTIGNLYNSCHLSATKYNVGITNNFNWSDGKFGKDDSCWWGCYEDSRDTLYCAGGYGMLFFADGSEEMYDSQGTGRFWLMPIDDYVMAFNPYGVNGKDGAAVVARLLEKETGVSWTYGKREFHNTGNDRHYPYINGDNGHNDEGGSKVFVVYRTGNEPPPSTLRYNFVRKTNVFNDDGYECENCGAAVDEDEAYGTDTGYVCSSCHEESSHTCNSCDRSLEEDDIRTFSDREGEYCERCVTRMSDVMCHDCGCGIYLERNSRYINGESYCETCAESHQEEENEDE